MLAKTVIAMRAVPWVLGFVWGKLPIKVEEEIGMT